MIIKTIKHSIIYSVSAVLTLVIPIVFVPLYTRFFAPHELGILDLLYTVGLFINIVINFQLSQAVARFFPDTKSIHEKKEYFSTAFLFILCSYSIFILFSFYLSKVLTLWLLHDLHLQTISYVALLSFACNGIYTFLQNQLRWELKPKPYALISIVTAGISIALVVIFVVLLKWGIIGVFWGQAAGYVAGGILAFLLVRHNFKAVFVKEKLISLLRFSLPLVPSGIFVFFSMYIDRFIIKEMLSLTELGMYGVAYRIALSIGLLTSGLQGALTPLIYSRYREKQTAHDMAQIFHYFIFAACLFCFLLSSFATEIIAIIATAEYLSAALLVPVMILAVLFTRSTIFLPGLGLVKKTYYIAIIDFIVVCVDIILSILFVPIWGLFGVALAVTVGSGVGFVILYFLSQRYYFIPFKVGKIGMSVAVTAIFLWYSYVVNTNWQFELIFRVLLFVFLVIVLWKIMFEKEDKLLIGKTVNRSYHVLKLLLGHKS